MAFLRPLSLKWKLSLLATGLSVAMVVGVSLLQNFYLKRDYANEVAAQQFASISNVAHDVDGRLASSLTALERSAASLPVAGLHGADQFRDYYASRPEMRALFDDLLLFDRDGGALADYPRLYGRVGMNVADRDYFKRLLATRQPTISEPLRGRAGSEPVVLMAVPIKSADGEIEAVLVGRIRLARGNALGNLATAKVGRTGHYLLLTSGPDPVYVVHPDPSLILTARPRDATGTTPAPDGFEGSVEETDAAGVRALVSYRRLHTTDWVLASALPVAEAYAPIVRAQRRVALVALFVALLIAPLVWFATWRLFLPLTRLLATIEVPRDAAEDESSVGTKRQDEFGVLLHGFEELMRERDQAASLLRDSEQMIRSVTDHLPALVCYIDRDHRFRFNNRAYEAWVQKPVSEITGRTVAEIYGTEMYERLLPHLARAFEGEVTRFELAFPGRDGRTHYAQCAYQPHVDGDGTVRGLYGLVTDVTKGREADSTLIDERARMAAIIEGTNAGTWEWNVETGEGHVNARWAEILGHTLDELGPVTIDTWTSRVHPVDLASIRSGLEDHFAGRRDQHEFEARLRHRSGEWIWVIGYGRVSQRRPDGRPLLMHGVHIDISARKRAEGELRVSQQVLTRTGVLAGVGGWEMDIGSDLVTWSDETCRLHDVEPGYRPGLLEAIGFYDVEDRAMIERAVRQGIETGAPWDLELRLTSARGRKFWARAVGAVEHEDGKPARLVGAFQDVTARKAIEQELSENRQLLQTTLDSIGDAVITTDVDGVVRWLNPVAERMTGWPKAEAEGRSIEQVFVAINEQTRLAAVDPVAACVDQRRIVVAAEDKMLLSRNGEEFAIEDSASPIRGADGHLLGVVLVFHDVSEQRRMTREMTHRAAHDPLTGLVNRAEFQARLQRLAMSLHEEDRSHALLYIDLDHFKLVNDACGHAVGDELLLQVSALMRGCVRSRDTVARLGGDEFGVILEHCDVQQAQRIAQKICDESEAFRFTHDGRRYRVGTSIGLIPFDRRWDSLEAAIQAADASCYAAKAGGRNRVHVWVDADAAVSARHGELQWVSRLEQALDENRFELYGQRIEPIAGASSGLHCEVLLRLREPDGTLVLPGLFLPAAERFHMATRIDRWVIREVFARLDDRSNFANDVEMIAINLSGHSIGDRAFHRDVVRMIRAASFDVRKLCFEITETVAVTNFTDAKRFIDEVRGMGVKIALDDFGAGASSFGYLKSLPVDFLKIDGSFITSLLDDALDDAAVRCFREVARVVGVATIAEFVEREDVHDVLRAIGIDMAQGYLIHRPEPLSAMTAELV